MRESSDLRGLRSQVFLEKFTILIDQERHHAGPAVLSRVGEKADSSDHVSVDDIVAGAV